MRTPQPVGQIFAVVLPRWALVVARVGRLSRRGAKGKAASAERDVGGACREKKPGASDIPGGFVNPMRRVFRGDDFLLEK